MSYLCPWTPGGGVSGHNSMSAIIETERMNLSLKNKIDFENKSKHLLWIVFSAKGDQALFFALIYESFYGVVEEEFTVINVAEGLPALSQIFLS